MNNQGEHNSQAKLAEKDVRAIRLLHAREMYTARELAALYGVRRETIHKIVARETWKAI